MATLQQLKDASNDPRLQDILGKKVIIGIYQFYKGDPVERSQDFGRSSCFEDGMMMLQIQGREFVFPYSTMRSFSPRVGYILDATGKKLSIPISWYPGVLTLQISRGNCNGNF